MMSAPWARFTIFSTPQTSPIPRPISPYSPPSRIPLTRIWPKSCTRTLSARRSTLRPGRNGVAKLGEEVFGVDRDDLPVLDLDHRLRQRDLPVRLELDVAVEALEVDFGDLVAQ